MNRKNVMTMTMFIQLLFKFKLDHDTEDFRDGYEEMMDLVRDAGYDAVDVTSWEVNILGIDAVKEILGERNLGVSSLIYADQFAAMDDEGFDTRIEQAKRGADMAETLGTDIFMLVPQAQKEISQYTAEEIRARMIAHWIPITAYAKEKGLHVVAEDTPDLKLHFCRAADVKEVLDAVPGLELVYDSANMILVGEDPVEYLKEFAGRIAYVHLKDFRIVPKGTMLAEYAEDGTAMTTAPTGEGMVDLRQVIETLKAIGYQGEMTIEFRVDDDKEYLHSLIRSREYIEQTKE